MWLKVHKVVIVSYDTKANYKSPPTYKPFNGYVYVDHP